MSKRKKILSPEERARLLKQLHRDVSIRQGGYRERALQLFPHVCARCGRAFEGARLKELTVHHKDHNHDNNPPDGSNWELLCGFCHDHEHEKYKMAGFGGVGTTTTETGPSIFKPFEGLDRLLPRDPGSKSDPS